MAGRFVLKPFYELNIDDPFFDSLKRDYPGTASSTGFEIWFQKKSISGQQALVFEDEYGLGAFLALKEETEGLLLKGASMPQKHRMKICTIKISERYQGKRIGEGAIGLVLWEWQKSGIEEIYVTVFESRQQPLVNLLERFGFLRVGINNNDEAVYAKNRLKLDFSNPYKSFPFIQSNFDYAGYVIIDDNYHDTMFAYSELAGNKLTEKVQLSVTNGLSKIYVGQAPVINHKVGEPVLIYRRYTQGEGKKYRSCVTSYCMVTKTLQAKKYNNYLMTFDELIKQIGNKSVFDKEELFYKYTNYKSLTVLELLYYGFFGSGNNVNMDWLDTNGYWTLPHHKYPTEIHLTVDQFKNVLMEGNINVQNVIINQSGICG